MNLHKVLRITLVLAFTAVLVSVAPLRAGNIDSSLFAPRVEFTASPDNTLRPDIASADLDGDGKLDLALVNSTLNTVSVFKNTTSGVGLDAGSFAPKVDLLTGQAPSTVAIADLDGDGKPDLAVGNAATATISLFRNTTVGGTLSFAAKVDVNSDGSGGNRLAVADLDGDGKPELIFAGFFMALHHNFSTPGSFGFGPRLFVDMGGNNWGLAVRDLDGDGKPDLAVANRSTATLSLKRNISSPGSIDFEARVDFPTAATPENLAVGDLNNDGRLDLAVGHLPNSGFGPINLTLFQNNSTGGSFSAATLGPRIDLAVGAFSILGLADLNADGKLDLIGCNDHAQGTGDRLLAVMENVTPAGTQITSASFATKVTFPAAPTIPNPGSNNGALSVVAGDLDGDGTIDLATGHTLGDHISIFWQPSGADVESPVINCPPTVAQGTDAGQCSATVVYAVTTTDNSGSVTVTCVPASGSDFDPGSTTVECTALDAAGNSASCAFTVNVHDQESPVITCPISSNFGCHTNTDQAVHYAPVATDNCDSAPVVTCQPPSGSFFAAGTTTVICTAQDASGNEASCHFEINLGAFNFDGFHSPIGGADASGGSFHEPLRTFKMNKTIPVKFAASCDGTDVVTGIHTLQVTKYTDQTTSDLPIETVPTDAATIGNQFRLTGNHWHFNLDTEVTGMSIGIWKFTATLSDGSKHSAWIQLK